MYFNILVIDLYWKYTLNLILLATSIYVHPDVGTECWIPTIENV